MWHQQKRFDTNLFLEMTIVCGSSTQYKKIHWKETYLHAHPDTSSSSSLERASEIDGWMNGYKRGAFY